MEFYAAAFFFLELLILSEEYLEFLISSTCLGVNAKMHGLSWSFSLFCGTGEGRKECPSNTEVVVMLCLSPSLPLSHTPQFQFSPVLVILL